MGSIFTVDMIAMWKQLLAQAEIRLRTIMPVYFNASEFGGYGIVFGNTFGMILAHLLLALVGLLALIGLISVIKWLLTRKSRKMDAHEKWLKTGKM